jgi:predicted thioesterase
MPEMKLGNLPIFDLSRGLVPTTPGYQMWYEESASILHIDDKIFRFVDPSELFTPSTFTLNITDISLPVKIVGYQEGTTNNATSFVSAYNVDWGDGEGYQLYPAGTAVSAMTHTYTSTGTKTVKVDKVSKPLTGTGSQEWFTFSTGTINNTGKAIITGCDTLAGFFNNGLTIVGTYFLYGMFYNCSSLTTAPAIPSDITTVGNYFLYSMFYNCKLLTTAPEIPSGITGTIGTNFLAHMFEGCSSLTIAPAIPSGITTIGNNFLTYMFYNCSSLTTAPAIPSDITTVGNDFLDSMFQGCTSLTTAPEIPSGITTVGDYFLDSMFYNCSSLTTAPAIPSNITGVTATTPTDFLYRTFYNCNKATSQIGTAANQPFNKYTASTTSRQTYKNCTTLTSPTTYANIPAMWK